jgi:SAM-dependent methyltransferase
MDNDQRHIMNRYEYVRHIVSRLAARADTLLDVGCRDGVLRRYVDGLVSYCGLDLCRDGAGGRLDCLGNLEQGLPFAQAAYDFVVALDCLEHLNDLQAGAEELLRVAKKAVIITLPNMAYVKQRMAFFVQGRFSTNKYNLSYNSCSRSDDRHRWVTVLPQTDAFMQQLAAERQVSLQLFRIYASRKRKALAAVGRRLGLSASWWVPASLYVMIKE